MRYREFKLTEQQLDELKMSPSSLGAFAKSPVAKGIKAGFEAEMVFPGLGAPDEDQDIEPDYEMDERASSIDEIIDFFQYDDYGYGLGDRQADRLRDQLQEYYWEYADEQLHHEFRQEAEQLIREYIEENDWDEEEHIREYLTTELGVDSDAAEEMIVAGQRATSTKDIPAEYLEARKAVDAKLDEIAEESFNNQDGTYETVLDQYREDYSYPEEREFLTNNDMRYMSDVADQYGLSWPYMTVTGGSEDGFSEDNAQHLADTLSKDLGVQVKVSSGYHSTRRDANTWIFEPDSSLDADEDGDMPVEIVSPPMALEECLTKLQEFFDWADGHDAYTNKSTGFHMGVSLPNVGGKVDFVKLALFLGDEHVLQSFGREANHFCEAAMKKIRNRVKNGQSSITDAMNLMRQSLLELAHKSIASDEGFGKYTSINPKGDYIEFRSAGGRDYSKDIAKLKNTLLRYAQAMVVAADPTLERNGYYKKLYKLISPPNGDSALDLFARFASGAISKEELKKEWADAALQKDAPQELVKGTWKIYDKATGQALPGYQYSGYTEQEAFALAKQAMSPGSTMFGFKKDFNEKYELRNVSANTGKWAIIDKATGKTLEVVDSETRGPVADMASEKYAGQDYYIEPVPADKKPNLSRRAELAKRIKADNGAATVKPDISKYNYYIRDVEAGKIVHLFNATDNDAALAVLKRWKESHPGDKYLFGQTKFLQGHEPIDLQDPTPQATPTQAPQSQQATAPNGVPMWEIYDRVTGQGIHQFADHSQSSAWTTAQTWARENGRSAQMDALSVRPVQA